MPLHPCPHPEPLQTPATSNPKIPITRPNRFITQSPWQGDLPKAFHSPGVRTPENIWIESVLYLTAPTDWFQARGLRGRPIDPPDDRRKRPVHLPPRPAMPSAWTGKTATGTIHGPGDSLCRQLPGILRWGRTRWILVTLPAGNTETAARTTQTNATADATVEFFTNTKLILDFGMAGYIIIPGLSGGSQAGDHACRCR